MQHHRHLPGRRGHCQGGRENPGFVFSLSVPCKDDPQKTTFKPPPNRQEASHSQWVWMHGKGIRQTALKTIPSGKGPKVSVRQSPLELEHKESSLNGSFYFYCRTATTPQDKFVTIWFYRGKHKTLDQRKDVF